MSDLGLIAGYMDPETSEPPQMSLRRMLQLALKTWPYMRPMLKHLLVVLGFGASGGLVAFVTGFVGTDLWTNKVMVGEKLQPIQAIVLFVGDEYVTTDPQKLGNSEEKPTAVMQNSAGDKGIPASFKGKSAPVEVSSAAAELTQEQRRTVRNRLLIWGIVGAIILSGIGLLAWYYTAWIWHCINQNLRVAMAERAALLSLRYHDNNRTGDVMFRVYQDSAQIVNLLQSGILAPAMTIYYLVVGLFFVAAFDPLFALMLIVVAIPLAWLTVVTTPRIRRRAWANRHANSELTSRLQEVFAAIKVIKANHAEGRVFERFDADSRRALDTAYFLRLDFALITLAAAMLGGALVLLTEYIMVTWVIDERETFLGALVASLIGFVIWNYGAFSIAQGRIAGSMAGVRGLIGMWMRMQDLFVALERAFYLLDLEPEVSDPDEPVEFPRPISRVAWKQVSFGYLADKPLLRSTNLDTTAGTVTAIVGATGAGKSTLMSLLLRLYDPDEGCITVNDIDLRDMAIDDIRANIAIGLQKNVLFADSVANNIKFGTPDADRESIKKAAEIACADGFISQMDKGYDTQLGERGGKLSAGQRQRLSIARAIVRDTPVLILDEPTASLDARTEQQVLGNLAAWGKGKVIFLITHRLSTIRNADQIAFLEDGKIAELGQHDELMARKEGRYRAFVAAETRSETSGVPHE